ncbi:hypothetical protein V7266_11335 [Neobacillus drentensis]|uniref:hypothetical protein n=1 Tax=Neobacillus drentensis TaxID=220684 RepID=UPI002FFE9AFA
MEKKNSKMKIDAKKFAYTVISSQNIESNLEEEIAKKKLTLYLTAYWLAEKFNNLEAQSFRNMNRKDYEDLMVKLSGIKVH